jgi:hypothetical protein
MVENPEDIKPTLWIGALEFNPPVATRLGVYLAQMTGFELVLNGMFMNLARIPDKAIAEAIFGRIINISTRLDIIAALCLISELVGSNKKTRAEILKLVEDARKINTRRNEYIHGTYRIDENTKAVELITWVTSEGKKSKNYLVTPESIDKDTLKVRQFLGDYMTAFFPGTGLPASELPALPKI